MPEVKTSRYKAELLLLFVAFNWGFTFPFTKIILQYNSPIVSMAWRFFLTLVIFYIIFRKSLKNVKYSELKYGLILGLYVFAGFITQTIGMNYTTASNSAFITGIYLVLVPIVQFFAIKKPPTKGNIFGIIIILAGLYFLTDMANAKYNPGDLLTLICAVAFAFHIYYLDVFSKEKKIDFKVLVYGQFISITVLSIICTFIFEVLIFKNYFFIFSIELGVASFFNSIIATLLGFSIISKYQKFSTPVRAGIIYSMEQLFAVAASYFILNEVMTASQTAGAFIMLLGLLVSELYPLLKNRKNEGFS